MPTPILVNPSHMAVVYAEPDSSEPIDWLCPDCGPTFKVPAATIGDAIAATTDHAILEHQRWTAVDLYGFDGSWRTTYGFCNDPLCESCARRYMRGVAS